MSYSSVQFTLPMHEQWFIIKLLRMEPFQRELWFVLETELITLAYGT